MSLRSLPTQLHDALGSRRVSSAACRVGDAARHAVDRAAPAATDGLLAGIVLGVALGGVLHLLMRLNQR